MQDLQRNDTIFALSSGKPPAGVAIIRVSGSLVRFVIEIITESQPQPRFATLARLKNPADGSLLDEAILLYFPGPASFTGEDVVEFHCHGGVAVVAGVLSALSSISGLRMAEAGEFSRRALMNNKMDLVGVEGLADLISAETEQQKRLAHRQISGEVSSVYERWSRKLTEIRAFIEAELDFADEDDVPGSLADLMLDQLGELISEISGAINGISMAELAREGMLVVLAGRPNSGKSTLMNVLAKRDVAIVSDIEGTTRDSLEVHLDLGGIAVTIVDTAGLRHTGDELEAIGVERTVRYMQKADVILWLEDIGGDSILDIEELTETLDIDPNLLQGINLQIGTKQDLCESRDIPNCTRYDCVISSHNGNGLTDLIKLISDIGIIKTNGCESVSVLRERHKEALDKALIHMYKCLESKETIELVAERLRIAGDEIGRITGAVHTEDLLDLIFGKFCIGK